MPIPDMKDRSFPVTWVILVIEPFLLCIKNAYENVRAVFSSAHLLSIKRAFCAETD